MKNFTIRKIESRDDSAILNIVKRCFEEFGAPLTGSVYCDPRLEHLSKEFEDENAEYWVIEDESKEVIGGAGFFPTEGLPTGMAEVVKFFFKPQLRGKGIGHKMLSYIEERAKARGYKQLYIETFPEFSKAVNLYEKFGFHRLSHALGNSGHPAVTIWMEKDIE